LAILAAVPFSLYTLFRTDLRGFDSYAFLSQACGNFTIESTPPIANFVLSFIPCNILAIKVCLFLLFFLSLCGIAHLGSLYSPKKGWLAALFSFLSPSLFFEATKFENDQFAIPILVWAAYFFYRARKTGHRRWDFYAIALVLFAAGFWHGSVYWLIAFALSSIVFLFPGLAAFTIFWRGVISSSLPKELIVESQAWNGLGMVGFLFVGFALIPTVMFPQAIAFFILMLLQVKFAWFLMPLLSVGAMLFYANEKLDKTYWSRQAKGIMVVASLCLVVVWGFALQGHPPHSYQWEAVEYAISQSEDGEIYNDWNLGYWVVFKGGTPSQFGGGTQLPFGAGIVLTRRELQCRKLKTFKELFVYRC